MPHAPRPLTEGETRLCASVFGAAIDYARARVANTKWIFFQPSNTTMAPRGTIQLNDVFVDERQIVYTVDRHVGGLYVLEMDF